MKPVALSLAAIGLLWLAADQALADPGGPRSRSVHVVAGRGGPGVESIGTLHSYRQVDRYRPGYRGHHVCGPHCGCGYGYRGYSSYRSYVPRPYGVVVPYYGYYGPSVPYYYQPYRGFSYRGPGLSIGIGF